MKVMNTLIFSVLTPIFFARLITSIEVHPSRTDLSCRNKEALPICYPYELEKVEYYRKLDDYTYEKRRTICGCNCTIGRVIPMNPKPDDYYPSKNHPGEYRKEFVCIKDILYNPHLLLEICNTGDICQTDYLAAHGSETGSLPYVDEPIPRCICDRARECVENKKDSNDHVVVYYCQLKEHDNGPPHPCKGHEVYKAEFYSRGVKMDTDFKCKCEYKRKISKLLAQEGFHSFFFNTSIRKYYCDKKPDRKLEKCDNHHVAYRSYRYEYGKDRNDKTYEETEERYCNCPKEMELSNRSRIIKNEWTKPYDEVWEKRCMKPISNKLQKCTTNQVFEVKILRYKTTPAPETTVNTYIYCICEHNRKAAGSQEIGENHLWADKFIERQKIETTKCKISHWPKAYESCKDYAICQEDTLDYTGTEAPDKIHTRFITTYCKCDQKRVCVKVGKRENRNIHRCFLPIIPGTERNLCNHSDVDLVTINRTVTKQDGTEECEYCQLLNTFMRCSCEGKNWSLAAPDLKMDDNHNHLIKQHKCMKDGNVKKSPITYCSYDEVCKTYHYMDRGIEAPDVPLITYVSDDCNCTFPRECGHGQRNTNLLMEKCDLGEHDTVREPKLRLCKKGESYKLEIHQAFGVGPEGTTEVIHKRNTILLCKCEVIFYQRGFVDTPPPVNEHSPVSIYFDCPENYRKPDPHLSLLGCIDYAICREETYTEYGTYVGDGITYLSNNYTACNCDHNRVCNLTEQGHRRGEGTWTIHVNTYRCMYEEDLHDYFESAYSTPCLDDQKFLVLIDKWITPKHSELLNTFVKCTCKSAEHHKWKYFFENVNRSYVIDPSYPNQVITNYKCTKPLVDPREICGEHDYCYLQHRVHGGRERGVMGYFTHHEYSCICPNPKFCISSYVITAKCEEDIYGIYAKPEEE